MCAMLAGTQQLPGLDLPGLQLRALHRGGDAPAMLSACLHTVLVLQGRYQGVDWRDEGMWKCNAGLDPYAHVIEDAVSLTPMELMFVQVKASFVDAACPSTVAAAAYQEVLRVGTPVCPEPSPASSLQWLLSCVALRIA